MAPKSAGRFTKRALLTEVLIRTQEHAFCPLNGQALLARASRIQRIPVENTLLAQKRGC
jgi:hypothetical protein